MVSLSRTAKLTPMCSYLNDAVARIENETNYISRTLEIPVLYGTEYGPDLERISIHSGTVSYTHLTLPTTPYV